LTRGGYPPFPFPFLPSGTGERWAGGVPSLPNDAVPTSGRRLLPRFTAASRRMRPGELRRLAGTVWCRRSVAPMQRDRHHNEQTNPPYSPSADVPQRTRRRRKREASSSCRASDASPATDGGSFRRRSVQRTILEVHGRRTSVGWGPSLFAKRLGLALSTMPPRAVRPMISDTPSLRAVPGGGSKGIEDGF
jgi:hypothetical protein